jgi:hypothetical protein
VEFLNRAVHFDGAKRTMERAMTTYSKTLMVGVAAVALMAGQAWAQTTPRVGVVSAVNPAAVGTPPGADTRPIVVGSDVIFREKVVTTGDGQAQLMFLDQSTMMIGPNSQVVIDEFVFDPNTSSGKFAATLTQGSFRYIGGKLSKQGDATLKTPVATIGIRGSDIIVNHNAGTNASGIQNIHGNATVESNGKTVKLPTGFSTSVNGPGQAPVYPEHLTAAIINAAKLAFEGQPGKNAGAAVVPQNAHVENSGLSETVEAKQLAGIETAAGPGGGNPPPIIPVVPNTRPTDGASLVAPPPPQSTTGSSGGVIVETPNPTATMVGYVGGVNTTVINNINIVTYAVTNTSPNDVTVQVNPLAPSNSGGVTAQLNFSGLNTATPQVFSGDLAGAGVASTNSFVAFTQNINVNGTPSTGVMSMATFDRLTSSELPTGTDLPAFIDNWQNVTVCTCEFMSWGLWAGVVQGPPSSGRRDLILGAFVTGVLPNIAAEPAGAVTMSGHAIGVTSRAGLTSGIFTGRYDFRQRSGDVTISNFDGNTMNAPIAPVGSDWRHVQGQFSRTNETGPATTGNVNGTFYAGPNMPNNLPAGFGGNFNISNPTTGYFGSGVLVGKNTPAVPSAAAPTMKTMIGAAK